MRGWLRRAFVAALLLLAPQTALAQSESVDLSGWWRAELRTGADEADFYLRLFERNGRPAVQATMPVVGIENLFLGPYAVEGETLQLSGLAWTLRIDDGGAVLVGQMPNGLVRHHQIEARFTRSEPPPAVPALTPSEAAPAPAWTADLGAEVWAGLAHDARRRHVYVATAEGRVVALRARDGREVWSADLGSPVRATPIVSGNEVLVASDGALVALNARNGRRLWSAAFGPERSARAPISDQHSKWDHYGAEPVVDGDLILTSARDGCVRAHTRRGGAERWQFCTESVLTGAPAAIGDRVFFGGFDGNAYALARGDGAELWRRAMRGEVTTAPVRAGEHVLFGSRSHLLTAHDPESGEVAWQRYFWLSWVDSEPVIRDQTIYVGSSDLLAVQAFGLDGRLLWRSRVPGWSWARVAVSEGSVYAAVTGAETYFTPRAGALMAFARDTGALRWMISPERPEGAELYGFAAAPIAAGSRLYAADLMGRVYAFDDLGV